MASHDEDEPPVRPRVAFLGPYASYSHQATRSVFSEHDWELAPTTTIREIFDFVLSRSSLYGVIPFENSSHGPVLFTLEGLADRQSVYSSLLVCGEIYLDVHHYLLGRYPPSPFSPPSPSLDSGGTSTPTAKDPRPLIPRAKPLTSLKHIKRIYSHPQGFGQTGAFLSTYLRGVETIDVSSTSRAAELVASDETGASAAIASEMAAELNGLDVLARCIEDREDNTTRFFVIRRRGEDGGEEDERNGPALPEELTDVDMVKLRMRPNGRESDGEACIATAATAGGGEAKASGEEPWSLRSPFKTLVSFTVSHQSPGALADVLDCFRRSGLNLTSINSLPSLIQPFQYLFFVEFEGSKLEDPDGRVNAALEGVAKAAQSWRWLGSWLKQRD